MPTPTPVGDPRAEFVGARPDEPLTLWNEVVKARGVLEQERQSPGGRGSSSPARADLLLALEAYAASLTHRRLPIPYVLRDELRLRRLTRSR